MRAFTRRGRQYPVAIGLLVAAVFFLPALARALPGDTCPSNTAVINQITICVTPVQRPAGGCGVCTPPVATPNVCPTSSAAGKCCSNLSEAVFLAVPGDTIGVFDGPTSEPAVKGVADVGPNVIIDTGAPGFSGPFGSPFVPNQPGPGTGLRIEECRNAKIDAGNQFSPVFEIQPGAGQIRINGIDVIGGSVGILVRNSGTSQQPGTILKAIRAENNTAAEPADLTQLFNAQLTLIPSSSLPGFPPTRAVDDDLNTSWFANVGNACNLGSCPSFEIVFPQDVTVTELQMFGNREFPTGRDFSAGSFQLLNASSVVLFDSGVVNLPAPDRDVDLSINTVAKVRRVRFTAAADEGSDPGFAELKVFGFGASTSGAGIEVRGNFNQVSGSIASSNDIGFLVSGNSNLIRSNKALSNLDDGFFITGNSNHLTGNTAASNGEAGFEVTGAFNNIENGNRGTANTLDGFLISGKSNILKGNAATNNLEIGIHVPGTGNAIGSDNSSGNAVLQYSIGPKNIDKTGNKCNGKTFTFGAAGGSC